MGTKGMGKLGGISRDAAGTEATRRTYAWFGPDGISAAVLGTRKRDVSYCVIGRWLCARQRP